MILKGIKIWFILQWLSLIIVDTNMVCITWRLSIVFLTFRIQLSIYSFFGFIITFNFLCLPFAIKNQWKPKKSKTTSLVNKGINYNTLTMVLRHQQGINISIGLYQAKVILKEEIYTCDSWWYWKELDGCSPFLIVFQKNC